MERQLEFRLCKPYIYRKIRENSYKTISKKGEYSIEYIHTNIAGSLQVTRYNRSRYKVVFINNYMQLLKAILLANKNNMFLKT